ncbi:MAG: DNA recombination protein RmuC [Patescibacteria group bacterium]
MELSLVVNLLSFIGVLVILFILNKEHSSNYSNSNNQEVVNQIVYELGNAQTKNISHILEYINDLNYKQSKELGENQLKLEHRFSQMQISIQTSLNSGLEKTQNSIHERLQSAILNLSQLNKSELEKLHESTSKNFDLLSKTNQAKLDQINQDVQKRLSDNFAQHLKSFEEVTKNLGEMKATASRMIDSTTSIEKLNSIFSRTSSKAFGDFGERYLESILNENLHANSWKKQVQLPNTSDKIDFIVKLDSKNIGIDCKFPVTKFNDYLESPAESRNQMLKIFHKSVLEMAQSINKKYNKPGFVDHLLMYFPSDSMYSEVVNNEDLVSAMQKLKVSPVSPITLFPLIILIQTYQFKHNVNQNAEQIIEGLSKIKDHIRVFQDEFRKLGDKMRQAQLNYDSADRNLNIVQNTVKKLESSDDSNELY